MEQQLFNRSEYYSKTEVLRMYRIPWFEFESLNIDVVITFSSASRTGKATYVKKSDVERFDSILKNQEKLYSSDFSKQMNCVFQKPQFPRTDNAAKPVELYFKQIHTTNGIIYRVSYTRDNVIGTFFIEKVQGKWSIIKNPGAPIWVLQNEKEIADFLETKEFLRELIEKSKAG